MMRTREELADDFRALGVEPGDTVMLHASIRAVGPVAGGPDQIHLALKDALTEQGTLMMLAGCPRYYDEIGRGNLTPDEERELLEKLPGFDPLTMRSDRSNGALVELLRTYPGSRVNSHPMRFVFWGRNTEQLIAPQPWNYGFGAGSAFERFVKLDGKVLLLGSDHDNVTFLHYAEHIGDIPDRRIIKYRVPCIENGERVWRDMEEVDTENGAHINWPDRFFATITDSFLATTENWGGWVGDAKSYLFSAKRLLDFALKVMSETAITPLPPARNY